ncbi:MAG: peptidylprolyl isomerase [Candidatus Dormibacteria bacterium]
MKLLKGIPYVRQRTVARHATYVRLRTLTLTCISSVLALTSCTSNATPHASPGLVTIQTAVTCPAPPSHTAVAIPLRYFTTTPRLTLGHNLGYCAYIDTTGGLISVRLRPEYAPHAVSDFIYLAQHGFYDGLTFYQVCPATTGATCPGAAPIALAGDPTATGAGGSGFTVASDPVVGDYLFGAVAMYGSAPSRIGSQFFVSKGDSSSLARKYDIFGQVTDGIPALASLRKGSLIMWIAIEVTAPEP